MCGSVQETSVVFDVPFAVGSGERSGNVALLESALAEGNGEGRTTIPSVLGGCLESDCLRELASDENESENMKLLKRHSSVGSNGSSISGDEISLDANLTTLQSLAYRMMTKNETNQAKFYRFYYQLADGLVECLQGVQLQSQLYVAIPSAPKGRSILSKQHFVELLDYAEDRLGCDNVVAVFKSSRDDRKTLFRLFSFLGFELLAPGHALHPDQLHLIASDHTPTGDDKAELTFYNYAVAE